MGEGTEGTEDRWDEIYEHKHKYKGKQMDVLLSFFRLNSWSFIEGLLSISFIGACSFKLIQIAFERCFPSLYEATQKYVNINIRIDYQLLGQRKLCWHTKVCQHNLLYLNSWYVICLITRSVSTILISFTVLMQNS